MQETIIIKLATALEAMSYEETSTTWCGRWQTIVDRIMDYAPSGSGFDAGTKINWDKCKKDRIVFSTSFHHMNDSGYYDGWTDHEITITPSFFGGFDLKVSGRDKRGIKDYIGEVFYNWLTMEISIDGSDKDMLRIEIDTGNGFVSSSHKIA